MAQPVRFEGLSTSWDRRSAIGRIAGLAFAAAVAAMPAAGSAQPAVTPSRLSITIDGYEIASFTEAVLSDKIIVEGSGATRRVRTQGTATFKRPQGASTALWAWHESFLNRQARPQNLSVTAYDAAGRPVAYYRLMSAWPESVTVDNLKAGASEVLMESVTIVCEHIQRVSQ